LRQASMRTAWPSRASPTRSWLAGGGPGTSDMALNLAGRSVADDHAGDLGEVQRGLADRVEVVRERVQGDRGDDLTDLPVAVAGAAHRVEVGVAHEALRGDDRLGERECGLGPGVR